MLLAFDIVDAGCVGVAIPLDALSRFICKPKITDPAGIWLFEAAGIEHLEISSSVLSSFFTCTLAFSFTFRVTGMNPLLRTSHVKRFLSCLVDYRNVAPRLLRSCGHEHAQPPCNNLCQRSPAIGLAHSDAYQPVYCLLFV